MHSGVDVGGVVQMVGAFTACYSCDNTMRRTAEGQLNQARERDLVRFVHLSATIASSDEPLARDEHWPQVRMMASLSIKNALVGEQGRQWVAATSPEERGQLRDAVLGMLDAACGGAPGLNDAVPLMTAKLAAILAPLNEWPDLVPLAIGAVGQLESSTVALKLLSALGRESDDSPAFRGQLLENGETLAQVLFTPGPDNAWERHMPILRAISDALKSLMSVVVEWVDSSASEGTVEMGEYLVKQLVERASVFLDQMEGENGCDVLCTLRELLGGVASAFRGGDGNALWGSMLTLMDTVAERWDYDDGGEVASLVLQSWTALLHGWRQRERAYGQREFPDETEQWGRLVGTAVRLISRHCEVESESPHPMPDLAEFGVPLLTRLGPEFFSAIKDCAPPGFVMQHMLREAVTMIFAPVASDDEAKRQILAVSSIIGGLMTPSELVMDVNGTEPFIQWILSQASNSEVAPSVRSAALHALSCAASHLNCDPATYTPFANELVQLCVLHLSQGDAYTAATCIAGFATAGVFRPEHAEALITALEQCCDRDGFTNHRTIDVNGQELLCNTRKLVMAAKEAVQLVIQSFEDNDDNVTASICQQLLVANLQRAQECVVGLGEQPAENHRQGGFGEGPADQMAKLAMSFASLCTVVCVQPEAAAPACIELLTLVHSLLASFDQYDDVTSGAFGQAVAPEMCLLASALYHHDCWSDGIDFDTAHEAIDGWIALCNRGGDEDDDDDEVKELRGLAMGALGDLIIGAPHVLLCDGFEKIAAVFMRMTQEAVAANNASKLKQAVESIGTVLMNASEEISAQYVVATVLPGLRQAAGAACELPGIANTRPTIPRSDPMRELLLAECLTATSALLTSTAVLSSVDALYPTIQLFLCCVGGVIAQGDSSDECDDDDDLEDREDTLNTVVTAIADAASALARATLTLQMQQLPVYHAATVQQVRNATNAPGVRRALAHLANAGGDHTRGVEYLTRMLQRLERAVPAS